MQKIINFIQKTFQTTDFIPLHEPKFIGNEKKYLNKCIDSTFVSSVGKFVDTVENDFADYVGAKYAVATSNGTSALHLALIVAGVQENDEVITQSLSFVATANAITYSKATPVFIDVDLETLGMSPQALQNFLEKNYEIQGDKCINKTTKRRLKAVVPMHTFGFPCQIDEIKNICKNWNLSLIEDAAESLGSWYKKRHTGTFGKLGVFSFNGNKIITAGGGGMLVTDDELLAKKAKHLSTTAKVPHPFEYEHDTIGYNYRMPNLNAALLLGQLENLDKYLENKKELAHLYEDFFKTNDIIFIKAQKNTKPNYWLNTIVLKDREQRDEYLNALNNNDIMSRPIWKLLSELDMYKNCQSDDLKNSKYLQDRIINIPSSVR